MAAFFDTHTHFDALEFDADRQDLALQALEHGVQGLILVGYQALYFPRLLDVRSMLNNLANTHRSPVTWVAAGLHPAYIVQHALTDLQVLEDLLQSTQCVAVGEIGLDTYLPLLKEPKQYEKQKKFFGEQLALATHYNLPTLLHVRRAHADTLALLKKHQFKNGGIAHAFGGGIEEAKQYIQLGFKLGITGLICNPNAKKLRSTVVQVVKAYGLDALVLETDCPDMLPINSTSSDRRNAPHYLSVVFDGLVALLEEAGIIVEKQAFAKQLWHNTQHALNLNWEYGQCQII